MSKSYTITHRVYCYDAFEEEDIPAGMTPEQYAEYRYSDGYGDIDSHTLLVFEDDVAIYDGEDLKAGQAPIENSTIERDGLDPYRTSEDDNPEFWEGGQ